MGLDNYTVSNLPLLSPIMVSVPAGTQRIISFKDEFLGVAVAISIQNQDAANAVTYRYGGQTNPLKQCPASSFRTIDGTKVDLLEINSGAAGITIIEAQVLPLEIPIIENKGGF